MRVAVRARSVAFVAVLLAGCRATDAKRIDATSAPSASTVPPSDSATAEGAPTSSAAPQAPRVADTWFVGTWTGTYQSTAHRIDLPPGQGGLPEWKVETKIGIGGGTLSVVALPDGSAAGSAEGPLGRQDVRGSFDGELFTARLIASSSEASSFQGTVALRRNGDWLAGELQASSTDGRNARAGTVTLTKSAH